MTTPTTRESLNAVLAKDVLGRIVRLQEGYLERRGPAAQAAAQGDLARLRVADPADPTASPSAWRIVQDGSPIELAPINGGDEPTRAESARHCALVVYALHQQSRNRPMHVPSYPFAQAVRLLGRRRGGANEDFDTVVRKRFDQVMLATTWGGRTEHLTALVRMMRAEEIGFDYGRLTKDLYRLADTESARGVRIQWARDLYRHEPNPADPSSEPDPKTTTEGEDL